MFDGQSIFGDYGYSLTAVEETVHDAELVERGLSTVTGLVPAIGYDLSGDIAKEAAKTGRTVREIARERAGLDDEALKAGLDPFKMTEPEGSDS